MYIKWEKVAEIRRYGFVQLASRVGEIQKLELSHSLFRNHRHFIQESTRHFFQEIKVSLILLHTYPASACTHGVRLIAGTQAGRPVEQSMGTRHTAQSKHLQTTKFSCASLLISSLFPGSRRGHVSHPPHMKASHIVANLFHNYSTSTFILSTSRTLLLTSGVSPT
jgi:hypothetical protein